MKSDWVFHEGYLFLQWGIWIVFNNYKKIIFYLLDLFSAKDWQKNKDNDTSFLPPEAMEYTTFKYDDSTSALSICVLFYYLSPRGPTRPAQGLVPVLNIYQSLLHVFDDHLTGLC